MIILCDLDSILADFLGKIIELRKEETGEVCTQEQVGAWDYVFSDGATCYDYFSRPGFFRSLAPIKGAREAIKTLRIAGHEVLIVSSATLTNAPAEKFEWLAEHLPEFPRKDVIFCARKGFVRGDVMIDDFPKNIEEWKAQYPDGRAYTLKYAYNADCSLYVLRADSWDELVHRILKDASCT